MRFGTTLIAAVVAATLQTTIVLAPALAAGNIIRTDTGFVSGAVKHDQRSFQGIPFAAPPVGDNRWRDPQPAQPWRGIRDATKPGPRCAQDAEPSLGQPASDAEDCLHLNVTTPRGAVNRPVLVWLHGGGFKNGAGADYDPEPLVRNGSVVVTSNYRLGAFGFFGLPGLGNSGAFGLADQQAALRWVQRNIRAFGGNPHNVTLFGSSAGGLSTCAQLTSSTARNLFHKAIIQSGPCQFSFAYAGQTGHVWQDRQAVERAGATAHECQADLACLRKLAPAEVRKLTPQFSMPAYGTEALPVDPVEALRTGDFAKIPVLAGTVRDETTVFMPMYDPMDAPTYDAVLTESFGADKARQVREAFPPGPDARVQLAKVLTSFNAACPNRELTRQVKAFGYEFAEPEPPMIFRDLPPFAYGTYHGSELPFLFRMADLSEKQQRFSRRITEAWTRFAATGSPGWTGMKQLTSGPVVTIDHRCDLWSAVVPIGGERQER